MNLGCCNNRSVFSFPRALGTPAMALSDADSNDGAAGVMAAQAAGKQPSSFADLLASYAPAINAGVGYLTDPVQNAAVLQAKLENAIASGKSGNEIRILTAKLQAARLAAQERIDQRASLWEWQGIGKFVAIGLGALLVGGIVIELSGARR